MAALALVVLAPCMGPDAWLVDAAGLPRWRRPGPASGVRPYLRSRTTIVRQDCLWANAFRPLARWLGQEEAWILSFCAYNNRRVREAFGARRARRALMLLPHCIQLARCKADIIDGPPGTATTAVCAPWATT